MGLIGEEDKEYLRNEFDKNLKRKVELLYFEDKEDESQYSKQTKELLEELAGLNDNLFFNLKTCDDSKDLKEEGLELCPSLKLKSERKGFINFYGTPAGHEFTTLVEGIKDMGSDNLELPEEVVEALEKIDEPVDIKVFVTSNCPYCPKAVRNAHLFSLVNNKIKSSMVDAARFRELSREHQVSSVPHILVNSEVSFVGSMPPISFLDKVKEAVK